MRSLVNDDDGEGGISSGIEGLRGELKQDSEKADQKVQDQQQVAKKAGEDKETKGESGALSKEELEKKLKGDTAKHEGEEAAIHENAPYWIGLVTDDGMYLVAFDESDSKGEKVYRDKIVNHVGKQVKMTANVVERNGLSIAKVQMCELVN